MGMSGLRLSGAGGESALAQQALCTHDMQDKDLVPVVTIEDAARGLDYLTVARAPKLLRAAATVWVIGKLLSMRKYPLHKLCCCNRIFQSDGIGNRVEIRYCGFRPDYFSHLARRFLA